MKLENNNVNELGKLHLQPGPFAGGFTGATNVLCQDGERRNAFPSYDGIPDTFFSVPMFVYVGKVRVYGYVTPVESVLGTNHDDVRFIAYTYRKHFTLVGATKKGNN